MTLVAENDVQSCDYKYVGSEVWNSIMNIMKDLYMNHVSELKLGHQHIKHIPSILHLKV